MGLLVDESQDGEEGVSRSEENEEQDTNLDGLSLCT